MHQIRNSIAFHYKFYGNQRRLYDILKTAHTVRHNPWTAEDNIMGSGPVSSDHPAHARCECGDIGPGNCTALTQPPLPYTAPPTTAQQQPAARFIFGPYLQAWAS